MPNGAGQTPPTPGGGPATPRPAEGGASSPGGEEGVLLGRATARRVFDATRQVEQLRRRDSRRIRRIVAPAYVSGGAAPFELVLLTLAGGDPGSATTKCSFIYDGTSLSGQQLFSAQEPLYGRTSVGRYVAAGPNTHGIALLVDGAYILLYAFDEVPDVGFCECTP